MLAVRMNLAEIAERLECELRGDGSIEIDAVAPIEDAVPGSLTFVANPRYRAHLATTRASAVILATDAGDTRLPSLRTKDPYLAFARAIELFYVAPPLPVGIHATAVIAADAVVPDDARIGPYCVIGAGVRLGARACLDAHVVLYPECQIGDDFRAQAGVVVRERARIGDRVSLQPGCVIGGDGFGYAPTPAGRVRKIIQAGIVVLEDDVEIGANSTIDRAAVGETHIESGVKIDNLVQIAHGCRVGQGSILAAQVGLSGSTRVGRYVQMGGQSGAAGHLRIGDGVQCAGQSGITSDIEPGTVVSGMPAQSIQTWRRVVAALPRLPELLRRVRRLEGRAAKDEVDDT